MNSECSRDSGMFPGYERTGGLPLVALHHQRLYTAYTIYRNSKKNVGPTLLAERQRSCVGISLTRYLKRFSEIAFAEISCFKVRFRRLWPLRMKNS